ncbi:MAG TPA: MarR family transcriptional regulator [Nocardioidaceae bacterium]|nr:MarR family transcriptional regulator [Nocardioidaceae bacterium]
MRASERYATVLGQVLELSVLMSQDMTQSFERDGLTPSRAHLLWELHERGPSTQRVLAEALDVSPRNVTGLVDGLVATGFVTREPHPTDRRATLVCFTAHGERIAKQFDDGRDELAEVLFAGMSERRLAGLEKGLGPVLERLRAALSETKGERP